MPRQPLHIISFVSAVLLIPSPRANAATINVPLDFPTIQAAINASTKGDEIIVAPGTYNEAIDFLGKAITLRSTNPLDSKVVAATIIDGTGINASVVKCISGESPATDGLTVIRGHCGAPMRATPPISDGGCTLTPAGGRIYEPAIWPC